MSVKYLSLLLLLNFNCSGMRRTPIPLTTEERLQKLMRDNADMRLTLARMEDQQNRIESQVDSIRWDVFLLPILISGSVSAGVWATMEHYYKNK